MKYIIISDLHLSTRFNYNLFSHLKELILTSDTIIINGDFWDDGKTSFEDFCNSEWNQLFPILKSRNCIYISGNHDPYYSCDSRVELFADQHPKSYEIDDGGVKYYVSHGQEFSVLTRLSMQFAKYGHLILQVIVFPLSVLVRVYELVAVTNSTILQELIKIFNIGYKKKVPKGKFLVMGHTHIPEIDLRRRYANSGFTNSRTIHYLVIGDGIRLAKIKIA